MAARRQPGVTPRTNGDGTRAYEIRWRQGGGRDGRRLSHTFTRQQDAVDALTRIRAAGWVCHCAKHVPAGQVPTRHYGAPSPAERAAAVDLQQVAAGAQLFGDYAHAHVDALTGVGPGYRSRFHRELDRHFPPFLAQPVAAITDREVKVWIRGLEEGSHPWTIRRVPGTANEYEPRPLSATTIHRLLVQAGSVMAAAQDEGLIRRNPFRGHRVGRRDRDQHTEMTTLTHDEWELLRLALPERVYRDLCTVLVGTGMRFGEATALAVGAVDPLARPPRLHVARAWQDNGAGGYQLGTPKSSRSRRTITFTRSVLDALIPHLSGKRDEELVFTTQRGAPVRHSNFYHRVWRPAVEAAGLDRQPRVHDLRHTHVSWLIGDGVDVAAVSKRLGHESITTTIDRYHHILPSVDDAALAALERAMPPAQTA